MYYNDYDDDNPSVFDAYDMAEERKRWEEWEDEHQDA